MAIASVNRTERGLLMIRARSLRFSTPIERVPRKHREGNRQLVIRPHPTGFRRCPYWPHRQSFHYPCAGRPLPASRSGGRSSAKWPSYLLPLLQEFVHVHVHGNGRRAVSEVLRDRLDGGAL